MLKAVLILAALVAASEQAAVTVSVYYESLCPDSIRFIRNQLFPTWEALGSDYMLVDFLPYGKASHTQATDGTWSFTCQHGPEECRGNKMQACALNSFDGDQDKSVKFVHCAMADAYPPDAGQKCATEIAVDFAPISVCSENAEGDVLLAAYGQRTHTEFPDVAFVPNIAFDGVYTDEDENGALTDLLSVVCGKLTGTKPPACTPTKRNRKH